MSLPALQQMQAKRLADEADMYGYAIPGIVTPAGRALQCLGASRNELGAPLAMLSVYAAAGGIYITPGFVGPQEIDGTGRIDISAGDRVYVKCEVQRETKYWYTQPALPPLEDIEWYYLTGAYLIKSAAILIVKAGEPAPQNVTSSDSKTAVTHRLVFTMPANEQIPEDGTFGGWLQINPGTLTL